MQRWTSLRVVLATAGFALAVAGCGGGGSTVPPASTNQTVTTQSQTSTGSPHFIANATSASISTTTGDLTATFKEAGLPN